MNNPEQELKQYRDQIAKDVIFLLNTRLKLLKQFNEGENKLVWGVALGGLSHTFYLSLFDNLVTTLSWLFSNSKSDRRSLYWYLDKVKTHLDGFSDEEIDEQVERLNNASDISDKIKTVRDKWVAHRDPNAFNDPENFLKANNVSIGDFEVLINLTEEIINQHFCRLDGGDREFDLRINGIEILVEGETARSNVIELARTYISLRKKTNAEDEKDKAIQTLLQSCNKV